MIVSLSFLYLILIKIWAPRASWEINEHSYCYWNQHKGILCSACPYLNSNHMVIIHYFISRHDRPCSLRQLWTPEQPLCSLRRACVIKRDSRSRTRWHFACREDVPLRLIWDCVKLVWNTRRWSMISRRPYDCITLQWIASRWVEYYWWVSSLQLSSCRV